MDIVFYFLGSGLIWLAVEMGRKKDSKIPLISWKGLLQMIFFTIGMLIIQYLSVNNCVC